MHVQTQSLYSSFSMTYKILPSSCKIVWGFQTIYENLLSVINNCFPINQQLKPNEGANRVLVLWGRHVKVRNPQESNWDQPLSLTKKGWSMGHSAIISTLLLSGTLCGHIRSLHQGGVLFVLSSDFPPKKNLIYML